MKKVRRVILIVLIVVFVAAGAVSMWQRKNIEGVLIGINENSEEIKKRRDDNQTKLVEEIDALLQEPLRELTEEEKKQIEEGTLQVSDVYAQIFEEKNNRIKQAQTQLQSPTDKSAQTKTDGQIKTENKQTKDEIITKYMAQLYRLQSEFTAKAESTISQGAAYYEKLKKTQDSASAKANTIKHFTPIVRGVEADCDSRVNELINNLKNELSAIGVKNDITGTIKNMYDNEKQLKLAYYANKYLK